MCRRRLRSICLATWEALLAARMLLHEHHTVIAPPLGVVALHCPELVTNAQFQSLWTEAVAACWETADEASWAFWPGAFHGGAVAGHKIASP